MKKYKILLVDDNPLVLMTVGRNLEIEGYQITTAENGKNALKLHVHNQRNFLKFTKRISKGS
jgi:CheY-like chemotaxis protein